MKKDTKYIIRWKFQNPSIAINKAYVVLIKLCDKVKKVLLFLGSEKSY